MNEELSILNFDAGDIWLMFPRISGILGNMKFIVMQLFVSWYVILFYIPAFFVIFQLQNLQVI